MTTHPFLSMVIPAWNEQEHLPGTLTTVSGYLAKQEYTSEIIIVDDGSTDSTSQVAKDFISQRTGMPVARLIENDHRGKAYAVRTGVLEGQGKYILFADADLPIPIYEIGKVIGALEAGSDIAIGTREGIGAERLNEPFLHRLMGRAFNLLVQAISGVRFRDTQVGFKGFRREVAHDLFHRVRLYGADAKPIKGGAITAFDVEVLYLAMRAAYRIEEIPVRWEYGTRGKAKHSAVSVRRLADVIKIRRLANKGLYDQEE